MKGHTWRFRRFYSRWDDNNGWIPHYFNLTKRESVIRYCHGHVTPLQFLCTVHFDLPLSCRDSSVTTHSVTFSISSVTDRYLSVTQSLTAAVSSIVEDKVTGEGQNDPSING